MPQISKSFTKIIFLEKELKAVFGKSVIQGTILFYSI